MSLSRISALNNPAATTVVLAAANRMTQKPMIPMKSDDHHHHDDHHMSLPNQPKASTPQSLGRLLMNGNLTVSNSFTSIFFLMRNCFVLKAFLFIYCL
jgi:hypothetical protein